jgi:CRP-like cAMP-binding protein
VAPSSREPKRAAKGSMQSTQWLDDAGARAQAIGQAAPFAAWPRDALVRLAAVSSVCRHPSADVLIVAGKPCDEITVIAAGTVVSSVSTPGGRRLTFKIDDSSFAYGLASLADGQALQIDLTAEGPVVAIRIPHAAVRAELACAPALWESVAIETIRRSRRYARQLNQFVLDTPLVRAAALLLGLLGQSGHAGDAGPVTIGFRLPQERLAEMLGISRQWATAVVRELSMARLVEWRYGRVTLLDVKALRQLAAKGSDSSMPAR